MTQPPSGGCGTGPCCGTVLLVDGEGETLSNAPAARRSGAEQSRPAGCLLSTDGPGAGVNVPKLNAPMEKRRRLARFAVTNEQRALLERWVRGRTSSQRLVLRSRIVLLAAEGFSERAIAERLGVHRQTVRLWKARFARHGPSGLTADAPGRGRKPSLTDDMLADALRTRGVADRSIRQLARDLGVSSSTVHRAMSQSVRRRTDGGDD